MNELLNINLIGIYLFKTAQHLLWLQLHQCDGLPHFSVLIFVRE